MGGDGTVFGTSAKYIDAAPPYGRGWDDDRKIRPRRSQPQHAGYHPYRLSR
jgi:hypothetical protein